MIRLMKREEEINIIHRLDLIKEKLDDMEKSLDDFEKLDQVIKKWDIKLEKKSDNNIE